jgi:enamine deaminase RidA (YjgF/YER057c/UK114 family)
MRGEVINPASWGRPKGYSNGIAYPAGGRILCIAGQVGWNENEEIVSETFSDQFGQALRNVLTVVETAGGTAEHIAKLTVFVTDKSEYLGQIPAVGAQYREIMSKWYPAMALLEIKGLVEAGAKVEIEAMAVVP